jgi:hypothetical protein
MRSRDSLETAQATAPIRALRTTRRLLFQAKGRLGALLYLWIEIEERLDALPELLLNLLAAAFEDVHGHPRLLPILELDGSVAYFGDFLRGKEPHAVDQSQVCHGNILSFREASSSCPGNGASFAVR